MAPERSAVDDRIARLERALSAGPDPERGRALRMDLVAALAMRYVGFAGADDDRERAERNAAEMLADEATTAEQRRMLELLRFTLRMVSTTPAAVLRGQGPVLDAEALRRTEQWQRDAAQAAPGQVSEQPATPDAIDTDDLRPEIRWAVDAMRAASGLLTDLQQPDRDGEVTPETGAALHALAGQVPSGVAVGGLVRGLAALVAPDGQRVTALEAAVAELTGGGLLRPVLQRDLARALVEGSGSRPDALRRATGLLEQAAAGMAGEPRMREEAEGMLAGALVASAAVEQSADRAAAAEDLARRLVAAAAAGDDPARLGAARFLSALTGLLRGFADEGRDLSAALDELVASIALLPVGHPLRPVAVGQLGAVLSDRHLMDGLLADADGSIALLERATAAVTAGAATSDREAVADAAFIGCVVAVARIGRAVRLSDAVELADASAALRDGLVGVPAGHPVRSNLEVVLGAAELGTSLRHGHGFRPAVSRLREALTGRGIVGVAPGVVGTLVGSLDVVAGVVDADPVAVRRALRGMEADLDCAVLFPHQFIGRRALLGKAYLAAAAADGGVPDAVDRAVEHLQEARRLIGPRRGDVLRVDVLRDLSVALRACGAHLAARRAGLDQLLSTAALVLLQSGAADALSTARGAAAEATRLVGWCLEDGDPAGAVEALELGRALTLHAATATSDVPGLLESAGHPDLARAWRTEAAARRIGPTPSITDTDTEPDYAAAVADVRHRALDVLQATREGKRLLVAPPPAAISRAIATLGRDALAYLVPGGPAGPGHVLVVDRRGAVTAAQAPLLRLDAEDPLTVFTRTERFGESGPAVWRAALDRLCDWAGAAALLPLLTALGDVQGSGPGGVRRVVLVPCGPLAAVPWQAARLPIASGGFRHACQDFVLSTAASARQLREVASRGLLPLAANPLLVSGPAEDLPGMGDEVRALAGTFYPGATVLGPAATPDQVLDRLPGAADAGHSLLHLSCHATAGDTLQDSRLDLATPLSLRAVLEHASGRRVDADGPTVVLAACDSDLTRIDADEALTPATAFLAAGAATAVGSRWAVTDRLTAVVMFALHHFMVVGGLPAADALRAAQLWMLDPGREPLPDMPPRLARDARKRLLADVAVWAAFGHHGW